MNNQGQLYTLIQMHKEIEHLQERLEPKNDDWKNGYEQALHDMKMMVMDRIIKIHSSH